jgi:hypothetical protein
VTLTESFDVTDIGAGQGVEVRGGQVLLYGDAETGVVRGFDVAGDQLRPTGLQVALTVEGEDLIPHPTGFTHRDGIGTFMGNTVGGVGTIFVIDWPKAIADGNLDRAVQHRVEDDLAINGTRPELVELGARWVVATSDYGADRNAIRFYDPEALTRAARTSDPGVLIARHPCGPWVQSMHWAESAKKLILVQNQIEGLRWRLTALDPSRPGSWSEAVPFDAFAPRDELEGFHLLADGRGVFLSSSTRDNVWVGRVTWP